MHRSYTDEHTLVSDLQIHTSMQRGAGGICGKLADPIRVPEAVTPVWVAGCLQLYVVMRIQCNA